MKKWTIGSHLFFVYFNMFGAFVCAYANNLFMLAWCTGWAVYSLIQINKILDKQPNPTDIGKGD